MRIDLTDLLNNILIGMIEVLLIGLSIFVHELGHFIAAKILGLKVQSFSIGFGPSIWARKIKGIKWKIGWIPFGGYVSLPQMDPIVMDSLQEKVERHMLPPVSPWRKIVVAGMGSIFNILFAITVAWVVYIFGIPAGPAEQSSIIGWVEPDSEAAGKGIKIGEEIVSVNGESVRNWREIYFVCNTKGDDKVILEIKGFDGTLRKEEIPILKDIYGTRYIPGIAGPELCAILEVEKDSPAELAGLKPGDIIESFAGERVYSKAHLISLVQKYRDKEVEIRYRRDNDVNIVHLTPRFYPENNIVRIGVLFSSIGVEKNVIVHPPPSEQIKFHLSVTLRFLKALITPKEAKKAAAGVGGPVAVVLSFWMVLKNSVMLAIWFTGFVNINLALINLLPIPILDGGHILFSLIEGISRRKFSSTFVAVINNVFLILILILFVILTVSDITRFTRIGSKIKSTFSTFVCNTNSISTIDNVFDKND